jgi:hypothetical protein
MSPAGYYVYNPQGFVDKVGEDYSSKPSKDWDLNLVTGQWNPHWVYGAHGFITGWSDKDGNYVAYEGQMLKCLSNHGLAVPRNAIVDEAAGLFPIIKQNIDAGLPLIGNGKVAGYGHYLVIVGYDTGASGAEQKVVVFDPYGDANNTWNGTTSGKGAVYPLNGYAGSKFVDIKKIIPVHPIGIFSEYPGWHDNAHPQQSQPFVDCYNKHGGEVTFGIPWDNGKGPWVHPWPDGGLTDDTVWLQDFIQEDGHWWQLVLNQNMNQAFAVHGQLLIFWHNIWGYLNYGEPSSNEYYAEDLNDDKIVVQEFTKNSTTSYLGYNTQTGISRQYYPGEVTNPACIPGGYFIASLERSDTPDPNTGIIESEGSGGEYIPPLPEETGESTTATSDLPVRNSSLFGLYKELVCGDTCRYRLVEEGVARCFTDPEVVFAQTGIDVNSLPELPMNFPAVGGDVSYEYALSHGWLEPILGSGFASTTVEYLTASEAAELGIGSAGYYSRSNIEGIRLALALQSNEAETIPLVASSEPETISSLPDIPPLPFELKFTSGFGLYRAQVNGNCEYRLVELSRVRGIIDPEVFLAQTGIYAVSLPDLPTTYNTSAGNVSYCQAKEAGYLEPIMGEKFASGTLRYYSRDQISVIGYEQSGYYLRSEIESRFIALGLAPPESPGPTATTAMSTSTSTTTSTTTSTSTSTTTSSTTSSTTSTSTSTSSTSTTTTALPALSSEEDAPMGQSVVLSSPQPAAEPHTNEEAVAPVTANSAQTITPNTSNTQNQPPKAKGKESGGGCFISSL